MQLNGKNLCDFCFSQLEDGICRNCGITHENYKQETGLLKPGTNLLGKYIIGRVLGRGGFGATYLAYSANLNKPVAIKEYFPVGISYREKDEENIIVISKEKQDVYKKGLTRFYEEARNAYRFTVNPNIVTVYEFFYTNSTAYYSMEYLDGIDLKKYVHSHGGKLTEQETVRIANQIANALNEMHRNKVLHRDISPDNVFLCNNGEVKLIDFGASKQFIADAQAGFSAVIKQGFAPAEQYSKTGMQGAWTDIYALGATIYYMLTGNAPNDALDRQSNPQMYIDILGESSNRLSYIINRCMQPKIENRYQSIMDLQFDLSEVRFGSAYPPNPPIYNQYPPQFGGNFNHPPIKKPKQKNKSSKKAVIITICIILCIGAAVAAYFALKHNPKPRRFPDLDGVSVGSSESDISGVQTDVGEISTTTQISDEYMKAQEDKKRAEEEAKRAEEQKKKSQNNTKSTKSQTKTSDASKGLKDSGTSVNKKTESVKVIDEGSTKTTTVIKEETQKTSDALKGSKDSGTSGNKKTESVKVIDEGSTKTTTVIKGETSKTPEAEKPVTGHDGGKGSR